MRWAWRAGRPATCAEDLHERNSAQQRSAGNYLYYTVSGLMYPGTQRLYRKPLTGGAPAAVLNGVTDVRRNAQQGGAHMLGTTATGLVRIAQPDDASPGTSTHPLSGLRQALALQPVIIGPDRSTSTRRLGRRRYELTDHLGNVRVVLGDRKLSDFDPLNTPIPTHFSAQVEAYADYDPFGSLLPGRYAPGDQAGYRFGFQGQEKDDEIHDAAGTSYAFEYRMHDPRVGRFWSVDPLAPKYPELTPYQFAGNTPIWARELEGLESWYTTSGSADPDGDAGPSQAQSGPLTAEYAEQQGYSQYGLMTPEPDYSFSDQEIEDFANWNTNNRKTEPGDCLGCAVTGSEQLLGVHAGFRNEQGRNIFGSGGTVRDDGKVTLFDLGLRLEGLNSAVEIPTSQGQETESILRLSNSQNTANTAYILGPGGAYHSMIVTHNTGENNFSLFDQNDRSEYRSVTQTKAQGKIDFYNIVPTWPSRMWQLSKTRYVETRFSIR